MGNCRNTPKTVLLVKNGQENIPLHVHSLRLEYVGFIILC